MSAFAALLACSQALAGFVDAPAPRLKLGSDAALRAVSVCTQVDLSLPLRYQPVLQTASTDHDLPIDVRLEPFGGTPLPAGARIIVNDVGQAEVLELTNTRLRARGFVFDLQLALNALNVRSDGAGSALLVIEIGDRFNGVPGVRTELRAGVEFVSGSNAIVTTPCDAPPLLLPEDDTGPRGDDDNTYVTAPRFTVTSSEAQVTLLRNGVPVMTTAVTAGTASLADDGAAGFGLHRYQVRHGTREPSAGRWIELDREPGPPAQIIFPSIGVPGSGRLVASETFPEPVVVLDDRDVALEGIGVTFTLLPGTGGATASFPGGSTTASATTDANGQALTPWITTGTLAGTVRLRAEVPSGLSAEGELIIYGGAAASIERLSGNAQQVALGSDFAMPLVVLVRDVYGNPTRNAQVRFTSPDSGASAALGATDVIRATTVPTGNDGRAIITPRAVGQTGAYTITAHLQASPTQQVAFAAHNLRAAPASLQALTPVTTVGWQPGAAVAPLPSLRVLDAQGIAIADVEVRFERIEGEGSISGAEAIASATGIATLGGWQLGNDPDRQHRVRATVQGLAPLEFSARTRAEHDVAISIDNGLTGVATLSRPTWAVMVTNPGPSTAQLAFAVDHDGVLPEDFTCVATAASSCSTAGGAGNMSPLQVGIAPGGRIDIAIRARVIAEPGAQAGIGVGIVLDPNGFDPEIANNTAVDVDLVLPRPERVFDDGFE